eukprot:5426-Chlamydomonas_euryale.AAC.1
MADRMNAQQQLLLPGEELVFTAYDERPGLGHHQWPSAPSAEVRQRLYQPILGDERGGDVFSSFVAGPSLPLKVGTRVIALGFVVEGVGNGATGVVVGFRSADAVQVEDNISDTMAMVYHNCRALDVERVWPNVNENRRWPEV